MAVPSWFESGVYFNNKLAQLGGNWDSLALKTAFEAAGYPVTAEGLYAHFVEYGNAENVSPNSFFVTSEYLYNKAVDYYGKASVTTEQVKSMALAMQGAGMSAWDHFNSYWAESYDSKGVFNNPSLSFDVAKYMSDKLALMQQADPSYTMDMLVDAFVAAGLNPVEHYEMYGKDEGLTVTAGSIGDTYQLTAGDDALYGTMGNDYFNAKVGTLDDGDYIDGLGGNDTLYANVKGGGSAIAPEIHNVETILFRAQDNTADGSGSNISQAFIDAENISGMTLLGSDNSRASLTVEDVRIKSTDLTVRFANTDPGDVDFSVYFDPQYLSSEGSNTSGTLNIELMDVRNADLSSKPLQDNPFDLFKFQYTDNNGNTQIVSLELGEVKGDATYSDLLAAFQNALAKTPLAGIVTASLGTNFTAEATVGGVSYDSNMGQYIVLASASGTIAVKDASGAAISGTGWGVSTGTVPVTGGIVWDASNASSSTCPLIQTNIELDNVGRIQWDDASPCLPDNSIYGSEAGDMVVGSMAGRGGVERFDVVVDKGSWLSSLSSTNNALRMVTVTNGTVTGVNDEGNLFVGKYLAAGTELAGTDFALTDWMGVPRLLSTDGLTDVKYFDASAMSGMVNIGAQLTANSYDKYLKDVDGVDTTAEGYAPNGAFKYYLGTNDDTLNMIVNAGVAADNDFVLDIQAGAGDDLVNFQFDNLTGSRLLNQIALNNVTVDLGAGDDTMLFWGNGAITVADGAGDDRLYLGQNADDQNAVFVFGANHPAEAIILAGPDGAQPLTNEVVSTNNTGLAFTAAAGNAGKTVWVEVEFLGVTSRVQVATLKGTDGTIDAETVNAAIIKAINIGSYDGDDTLSALLRAKDGMGHSLLVESLVDGDFSGGVPKISFDVRNADGTTSSVTWGTGALYDGGTDTNADVAQNGVTAIDSGVKVAIEGTGATAEVQMLTVYDAMFDDGDPADVYTIVYDGVEYSFGRGTDATSFAGNMQTVLDAAVAGTTVTAIANHDGSYSYQITHGAAGEVSNDTLLVKGVLADVAGSDDGTISMNTVKLGAGDDVVTLNVNSGHNAFDTLVLQDNVGNDFVYGFDSGFDKIDLRAYDTTTKSFGSHDVNMSAALYGLGGLAVTAGTNTVLVQDTSDPNNYYVFKITAAGATVAAGDTVTAMGVLTLADDGSAITAGDCIFA